MSMRASDAGYVLQALSRGGTVDLSPDQEPILAWLRDAQLVRAAADPGPERERMAHLRGELQQISQSRASGGDARALAAREKQLRAEMLDLSERLAETEGATEVHLLSSGGPYRGAPTTIATRYQVTQRGRALLSDLAPRMVRIGPTTIDAFAAEMQALRVAFAWRADRAAQIHAFLAQRDGGELGAARRSAAIGLSAVREEPPRIAGAFLSTFRQLRVPGTAWTSAQDASAAECLCLAANDLAACEGADAARWLLATRHDLFTRYAQGHTEDALDAALLLAGVAAAERDARIGLAAALARDIAARGGVIPLSVALLATAGEADLAPHVAPTIQGTTGALEHEIASPLERLLCAVLLAFPRGDLVAQMERWRVLRQYLARFAPDGMAIAAALLSWISLEPGEALDDLRLAAAEIQKHRLADGGAETMSLAIKLLVSMAMLAAGAEGDHEERLALAPRIAPRAPSLGLHGALATLPLVTTALTAFHRPVLDAALEYERVYQSTHSSYVFGSSSGRSFGWG